MTVQSILDAVREGWNFVWPPCFLLLVLLVLSWILAPLSLKDFGGYLGELLQQQKKLIAILRLYGLRKFVGIIEAFVILFLLYVVHEVVPAVGNAIPGQLVYTPSRMLVRTVDHESLVCALASLPGATTETLEREINIKKKAVQAKLGVTRDDRFFNSDYWQKEHGDTIRAFNICKALMLYAVLLAAIEIARKQKVQRSVGFLLLVLSGLALVAAYFFGEQVYALEQEYFALIRDERVMADLDGISCQKISTDQTDEIRKDIWRTERYDKRDPGWRLEVFGSYFPWLRTRLFSGAVHFKGALVYFSTYSSGGSSDTPRLRQLVTDTSSVWRIQVPKEFRWDVPGTSQRLLEMGYALPTMIKDDQQMTGSLLRSNPSDGTLRFFTSPTDVFVPLQLLRPDATPEQKSLCPDRYFAELEQLNTSKVRTLENIDPFTDLRDLLITTEKLTCVPPAPGPNKPLVLGYRLARIEW